MSSCFALVSVAGASVAELVSMVREFVCHLGLENRYEWSVSRCLLTSVPHRSFFLKM